MTNLKKQLCLFLTSALLAMLVIPVTAVAASSPTFSAKSTQDGSNIVLELTGKQLDDVYAYEFRVAFDPEQVKFVSGKSPQEGFTADPMVSEGSVLFAHTKTGQAKGMDGEAILASLTFEKLHPADHVSFTISSIKLVHSSLELTAVSQELMVMASGALFTDIAGHWAEAAISKASQLGWVSGYADDTFRPQANITRGEFVTILVRALGLTADASASLSFKDVDAIPAWSKGAIAAAVKAGLVEGYNDGTFQADKLVTRAEMAAMIVRSQSIAIDDGASVTFADAEAIPSWAIPYVSAAADRGWIHGVGNNTFAPLKHATRAEATQMLINLTAE